MQVLLRDVDLNELGYAKPDLFYPTGIGFPTGRTEYEFQVWAKPGVYRGNPSRGLWLFSDEEVQEAAELGSFEQFLNWEEDSANWMEICLTE